jgi:MinD superfamily P-loop ATPase
MVLRKELRLFALDGVHCHLPRRVCNKKIISMVQQVVCFAFHDSRLLLETCQEAKEMKKIVTLFYLD